MSPNRPYVTITADTHAGASIESYREFLERRWHTEFDAWRGAYKNPDKKHIGGKKTKNWDSAERRADLERDGVAAEIIFPNTVPPFYDTAFHIAPLPTPEQYPRWLAGTRAHNRWLAGFCAEEPARRAGIGLIQLNDIDDAIEDVRWIAEHGLRGGVLLPLPAPSDVHLEPLNSPRYDRLWAAIQDCDLVINQHSGQGSPSYLADGQGAKALWASEMSFYARRNCWYGVSFPSPREIQGREVVGVEKLLWGNDYPHYEGCYPYSRENMRFALSELPEHEVRMILGENAAQLYGFDLEALRPIAERLGITPDLVRQPLEEIPEDSTCLAFLRARAERASRRPS